jgi:hypothetical protein
MTNQTPEKGAVLTERQVQDIAVAVTALNAGRLDGRQTVASIVAQVERIVADAAAVDLADLTEEEMAAVDWWMSEHMYGHQISNSYAGMSCDMRCRTLALGQAFRQRVLVPRRELAIRPGETP